MAQALEDGLGDDLHVDVGGDGDGVVVVVGGGEFVAGADGHVGVGECGVGKGLDVVAVVEEEVELGELHAGVGAPGEEALQAVALGEVEDAACFREEGVVVGHAVDGGERAELGFRGAGPAAVGAEVGFAPKGWCGGRGGRGFGAGVWRFSGCPVPERR